MQRMKTYDVPHKGLRNGLSQMSLLAGRTDYSNPAEVERLYQLGTSLFTILTIHAEDENSVTLAHLETRCPGCSQHDLDDHEEIHRAQQNLEQQLAAIKAGVSEGKNMSDAGAEFYLAFSEFHGEYLSHTAEEERVTQPQLWQYFTDEELAAHRGEIMAKNPPETLLIWFEFVIPAQRHAERIGLLTGFKRMAPAAFFAEAMQVVQRVLLPSEFHRLEEVLGTLSSPKG
ncbi:MAG TPA: hypothetical protein VHC96_21065 [Puia sp.]|nr:hypothetical protein [Puia sp.]